MDAKELSKIRVYLGKTQREVAALLGTSIKAVQSFEQGWRKVPPHVERQMLLLLFLAAARSSDGKSCWQRRKCTGAMKNQCPAFQYQEGRLCWLVNGTYCRGKDAGGWPEKITQCRSCRVFLDHMPDDVL
ncbi:MAG: helix-turn-helix transcriptional regulator [Desulfobacterales bacterium]|jgi:hypothetical protein